MQIIRFYRSGNAFGFLSNFSAHPVELAGASWPTSEHYYQAMKFPDHPDVMEAIRTAKSPGATKRLANRVHRPLRTARWHDVVGAHEVLLVRGRRPVRRSTPRLYKDDVMLRVLRAKFGPTPERRALLLETGDAILVEHSHADAYWGDGGDGSGLNKLGTILMEVRAELIGYQVPAKPTATPCSVGRT